MPLVRSCLLLAAAAALCGQVRYEDIQRSPGETWLTYAGGYDGSRYSRLRQINRESVRSLVPKWSYEVEGARNLETSPLVFDGIMYVTTANQVDALEARTGRRIWRYQYTGTKRRGPNRGVALLGERVFLVSSDAHLIALHRKTGAVQWNKPFAPPDKGYAASLAPLALKDRIIVGVSGGDAGIRGYITAISPEDGSELWRFWTVPARGERGSETWDGPAMEFGGGAAWLTGSYDANLDLIYWATGNPWPDLIAKDRRGENLYTCAVVALEARTGKLRWHFQFTPHDTHDWDAQSSLILADVAFGAVKRKCS